MKKPTGVIFLILLCSEIIAQSFPGWFLYPGDLSGEFYVGYTSSDYIKDSSIVYAKEDAALKRAAYTSTGIDYSQVNWNTELGTYMMKREEIEVFDTSMAADYFEALEFITDFSPGRGFICLFSADGSQPDISLFSIYDIEDTDKPDWVDTYPEEEGVIFGHGISKKLYLEVNSWRQAEQRAKIDIAKQVSAEYDSKTYKTIIETHTITKESLMVRIGNLKILGRWYDAENKNYHVFMRMKI